MIEPDDNPTQQPQPSTPTEDAECQLGTDQLSVEKHESELRRLSHALKEFCSLLASHVPRPKIVMLQNCETQYHEDWLQYRRDTNHHRSPGVYCLFRKDGSLHYVGKALGKSKNLDRAYHQYNANLECCWWIDAIIFDSQLAFLGAALEVFLIWKLDPPANHNDRQPSSLPQA